MSDSVRSPQIDRQAAELITLLVAGGFAVGTQLEAARKQRLRTYLASLIPPPATSLNRHFHHVLGALEVYLRARGETAPERWLAALAQAPVIQQADHSFLLLDAETFLNNYLFARGLREHGLALGITVQCSSVSCIARRSPLRGSPFLFRSGNLYNIFGCSQRFYSKAAFCTLPGELTTAFVPCQPEGRSLAEDSYLGEFSGRTWPTALEAFRLINARLTDRLSPSFGSRLLVADDRWSAELLAKHMEDAESPLRQLVFAPQVRRSFLAAKRALIHSAQNIGVNRAEPDFFWFREGVRLRPLLWEDGAAPVFSREPGCERLPFAFAPAEVAAKLRCGELLPDKILIFLARCLLPGIQAIGGPSQQDYVRLYASMLLRCHAETGLLSAEEAAKVARADPSRLGGAPLIELDGAQTAEIENVTPRTDLAALLEPFLERPVGETIGTLSGARYLRAHVERALTLS